MATSHIRAEQHLNPNCRTFHVTRRVTAVSSYEFGADNLLNSLNEEKPGKRAEQLAATLEKIPGIASGSLSPYEIRVVKGSAFNWAEVGPRVMGTIVKHLFPSRIGKTIQVSTVVDGVGQFANRVDLKVAFRSRKQPALDIEGLFQPEQVESHPRLTT